MSFKRYAKRPYTYCRKVVYHEEEPGDWGQPGVGAGYYTEGPNFQAHLRVLSAEEVQRAGITATAKTYRIFSDYSQSGPPLLEQGQLVYSEAPVPDRPHADGVPLDMSGYERLKAIQVVPYPGRKVVQFDAERAA